MQRRIEIAGTSVSVVLALMFVVTAASRLTSPYALEWMEGGMAMHALRLAEGASLYTPPGIDWTPFIYPPLYPWLVSWLVGAGMAPLVAGRLISIGATLGSALILASVARTRTGSRRAGLAAGALFLATFSLSGFWFDLARVDSLALFLALAAVAAVTTMSRHTTFGGASDVLAGIVGGTLMTASVMTKQTFLPVALAALPPLWWTGRRAAVAYGLALASTLTGVVVWLQVTTDGWFLTYVYGLPAAHAAPALRTVAALGEMSRALPAAALVIVATPFLAAGDEVAPWRRRLRDPWVVTGIAAIAASAWARAHAGSYENVLIPAYWYGVLALVCAVYGAGTRPAVRPVLAAALLLQAGLCIHLPGNQIPSGDERARDGKLRRLLAEAPGAVFFPDRPLAVLRAGQPAHAHGMALRDVARAGLDGAPAVDVDGAYTRRRFAAVIVRPNDITPALTENYVEAPRLTEAIRSAPFPVTGWYSRQLRAFRPDSDGVTP